MGKKLFPASFLLLLSLFFHPVPVSAHQPNYTGNKTEVTITEPEISRAFYGTLHGTPITFTVTSSKPFQFYGGLLVPDTLNARTDFTLDIFDKENSLLSTLTGSQWPRYYEEFARDWYLKGPEYKTTLSAGTYTLILSNPENKGVYVLAVGETESFPINTLLSLFPELIQIKTNIFGKPWYDAFINIFGFALGGIVVFIVLFILGVSLLIQKKKKNKKRMPSELKRTK